MAIPLDAQPRRPGGSRGLFHLHQGKTLTCVNVDVFDGWGRLCTRTLVSLVAKDALRSRRHAGAERPMTGQKPWAEGTPWKHPPGMVVPILNTLQPRAIGRDARGDGVAITLPWHRTGHGAEAICMAADISVGTPVALAFRDDPSPAPNPDLSVRILDDTVEAELAAFARLEGIVAGAAGTQVQIWCGDRLVGLAVCSSLLMP